VQGFANSGVIRGGEVHGVNGHTVLSAGQWRSKWGHAPRGAPAHFCCHLKTLLSRNLDQSTVCLKCVFFGKKCKKSPQRRGKPPLASGG